MQYFSFGGHQLSTIFKGNWQLAGGHGNISHSQAIEDLFAYAQAGVNTFDVGDIYTGAEELLGDFLKQYRRRYGAAEMQKLRVHTKFVPDLNALADLTKQDIRTVIERSLRRLGLEQLHLVQFHWWDFSQGDYTQAALHLDDLRREGLIATLGLTNFDCQHTEELLSAGVPVRSNQIQFSLLDPRPLNGMLELAIKHDVAIFCYGVLAGGLLGNARPGDEPANRSHIKYNLIIDEMGGDYYRLLLEKIHAIARAHHTTNANVATAFVLQTPGVSSAILGPRNAKHIAELTQLENCTLTQDEYHSLRMLLETQLKAHAGDIYSYERDLESKHGQIMKYNLNGMRPERTLVRS
ncbi:MAG TPA: aldo/keto reductase [Candidatus Saccharimonadales bacterium]|nr:aldo/keto reductase [Candidatus Saccharimonadales bacterium]